MTKTTDTTQPAGLSPRRRREESIGEQIKDMIIERKLKQATGYRPNAS